MPIVQILKVPLTVLVSLVLQETEIHVQMLTNVQMLQRMTAVQMQIVKIP